MDKRAQAAEAGTAFEVEGRVVVMVTPSGKRCPVAHTDFLAPDFVRNAIAEKWARDSQPVVVDEVMVNAEGARKLAYRLAQDLLEKYEPGKSREWIIAVAEGLTANFPQRVNDHVAAVKRYTEAALRREA